MSGKRLSKRVSFSNQPHHILHYNSSEPLGQQGAQDEEVTLHPNETMELTGELSPFHPDIMMDPTINMDDESMELTASYGQIISSGLGLSLSIPQNIKTSFKKAKKKTKKPNL